VNYRNPATITAFAKDITKSEHWNQDSDMVDATNNIAEGPKPALVEFSNIQKEIAWVVKTAISRGEASSTVIICRSRADIDSFKIALNNKGCFATEINRNTPGFADMKTVYLSTFHSAKGLEFENVFVPFLVSNKLPDPEAVANAVSEDVAFSDEIKLLYVATTRSKYGLYMTYSGTLSPLFPKSTDNYIFYNEDDVK
jgi:superfamily I DNA/RNA helicase